MLRAWRENQRLRGRILDLCERLEVVEADIVRLDQATKKLRGTVTGGIRKEPEPTTETGPDGFELIPDEAILEGKATFKDA